MPVGIKPFSKPDPKKREELILNNLPIFISHKMVRAGRIIDIQTHDIVSMLGGKEFILVLECHEAAMPIIVSEAWYRKHRPEVGGIFVRYQDGHESYSTMEPFINGYTVVEETMDIVDALRVLKAGGAVYEAETDPMTNGYLKLSVDGIIHRMIDGHGVIVHMNLNDITAKRFRMFNLKGA